MKNFALGGEKFKKDLECDSVADWKYNAVQDLKEYQSVQSSLHNLSEEIKNLEIEMQITKGTRFDRTPVQGGGNGYEDRMINNIDRRGRLEENLRIANHKVKRIESGLKVLSDKEKLVLSRFYVERTGDYIDRLCHELGYEKTQIYRIKDMALKKFTLSMFGIVDL